MPDVGAPPTLPPAAASHTSTQQWQSFEIRMRHRRAERCVLRAEVALEAGFEEDARAALDEAKRLNAQSPTFETLSATVAERVAWVLAERRVRRRRRAFGLAAAALLCLTIAAVAFWPGSEAPATIPEAAEPPAAAAADPVVPAPVAPNETPARTPVATAGDSDATTAPAPAGNAAPAKEAVTRQVKEAVTRPVKEARAPEPEPPVPPVPVPEPLPASEPVTARATPVPVLPDTGTVAPATAPPTVPIDRVAETLPSAEVPEASIPAAGTNEEARVRAALARYESAYSRLNSSAAEAVWPGVDERSLARAFEGLESQRVSLGRCSVTVQGPSARADCSGSVSWTPKIGSGAQTQSRRWRFELASANGAWQITRADVR